MEEIEALSEQGVKWLHDRDFEQAIALFEQVLQLDPNYTDAWKCPGLAFGHVKHIARTQFQMSLSRILFPTLGGISPQAFRARICQD
jgi:Tfp pilus assembly protein PilF